MFRSLTVPAILLAAAFCAPSAASAAGGEAALASVHEAFDSGAIDARSAVRRYRVVARNNRHRPEVASDALFAMGVAYEHQGMLGRAAEAYLEVATKYRGSSYFMPAVDALLKIGGGIEDARLARRLFAALSDVGLGGPENAYVRYRMGAAALKLGRYADAEFDFQAVLRDHPAEEWASRAYFALGELYAVQARRVGRDQTMTKRALGQFNSFIARYPDSPLREDAEERIAELRDRKAEHLYKICSFYLRRGQPDAFDVYHSVLMDEYGETAWAAMAAERLEE